MLRFAKPTPDAIRAFLAEQEQLDFTYAAVGATNGTPPTGYAVDPTRVKLGEGDAVFEAAKAALRRWEQFRLGWVEATPGDTPIEQGSTVAVVAWHFGFWWLNAARVVYVIDEPARFGFAYGTLPGHVESGEERFLVERDPDGAVWYDILAFSRPRHPLVRLAYPLTRRLQRRFARESADAMQRAVDVN